MLIIIHGDNLEKSADQVQFIIQEFKNKGYLIINISDTTGSFTKELIETGLFETKKLVIVDNLNTLSKKEIELIKAKKYNSDTSIVINSKVLLTALQIKSLGKPDRLITNIYPKLLWSFLDSFYPGNSKICIKLFNDALKTEAPELILFMLMRQLKDLYLTKTEKDSNSMIPAWKLSKMKNVAEKFDSNLLKEIISDIAKLDIKVKSSDTNLKTSIDLLIVGKLK